MTRPEFDGHQPGDPQTFTLNQADKLKKAGVLALAALTATVGSIVLKHTYFNRQVDQTYNAVVLCPPQARLDLNDFRVGAMVPPMGTMYLRCVNGPRIVAAANVENADFAARSQSVNLSAAPFMSNGSELNTLSVGYTYYDDRVGFGAPQLMYANDSSKDPSILVTGNESDEVIITSLTVNGQAVTGPEK